MASIPGLTIPADYTSLPLTRSSSFTRYDPTYFPKFPLDARQKSPTTKRRIETAFARLNKLGIGEDDVADGQELMRRADLFMSVTSVSLESIL